MGREADRAIKKLQASIEQGILDIVEFAHKSLVRHTPKKTGRLRANWQITSGRPANSSRRSTNAKFDRQAVKAAVKDFVTKGRAIYISNPLVYAWFIETGVRTNKFGKKIKRRRGPANMVRITKRRTSQFAKLKGKM